MLVDLKCPNCEEKQQVELKTDGDPEYTWAEYKCTECGVKVLLEMNQEVIESEMPTGPDPDLLYDQAREAKYRIDGK